MLDAYEPVEVVEQTKGEARDGPGGCHAWASAAAGDAAASQSLRSRGKRKVPKALAVREAASREESAAQARLVRDLVANPFRPATLHPSWLTPTVTGLARAIYEEQDFGRMPILADALEEADCNNQDLRSHCRGPGPHVRGCWVVDALTGRG